MTAAKTVVITGGNGGLGLQAARAIAARDDGATIVLASRDAQRTAVAAESIATEYGAHVVPLTLDLASLRSVREFADTLPSLQLPPVRALLCNAGIQIVQGISHTVDGYETTFAVNHLAHFLLTNLLLPQMPAQSRIVFVASDTHDPDRRTGMPAPNYSDAMSLARPVDLDGSTLAGRRRYTTSKLCNIMTAYEMSRRIGTNNAVCVNAFDPGLMPGTGLARDYSRIQSLAWRYLMPSLTILPLNIHTRKQSGSALAKLAVDSAFNGVTGKYFEGTKERRSSTESYDEAKAAELWRSSAELVGSPGLADL